MFGIMSDWYDEGFETRQGSGGGGGGGGEGCGTIASVFLICLVLSTMCNNSRVNENYLRTSNQKIESKVGSEIVSTPSLIE
jgi:hypothetical protein